MSIPKVEHVETTYKGWYTFIKLKWGTRVCRESLRDFMMDDGDAFELEFTVLMEVNKLISAHDQQFPEFAPSKAPFTF